MSFIKANSHAPAMTPTSAEPSSGRFPPLRHFGRNFMLASTFNVAVALFVTLVIDHKYRFFHHLTFSMSIGTVAWIFLDVSRFLLWGLKKPPGSKFFLLLMLIAPVAYFGGGVIGLLILNMPTSYIVPDSVNEFIPEVVFTLATFSLIGWILLSRAEIAELRVESATRQAHAAAVEKQAMQAQLQLLQTQIEPHMLFNTLANLQGLIALDPPRAQAMLDHLIHYLRATLGSSRAGITTLGQEFALLEAYLGLMSVRMGARLSYALHLPGDLRKLAVPPMLLQPLIENAIKHGIEPKVDGGRIDVKAERQGEKLVLTVSDTGLGIDGQGMALHSEPGTQVGTANVRERLQVLYGDAASLTLAANAPAGVVAQIMLPIES